MLLKAAKKGIKSITKDYLKILTLLEAQTVARQEEIQMNKTVASTKPETDRIRPDWITDWITDWIMDQITDHREKNQRKKIQKNQSIYKITINKK